MKDKFTVFVQSAAEIEQREQWLHTLPDKLTGKTNCEMRVELCVLKESYKFALSMQEQLVMFYGKALQVTHKGWEQLIENLATWDFTLLHDQWFSSTEIRCVAVCFKYKCMDAGRSNSHMHSMMW